MKFVKRINFEEFVKHLPTILADLARKPGIVLVEKAGKVYRLEPVEAGFEEIADPWAGYDPKKVREALKKTVGTWADLDADKMIEDIYNAREEGSRPANRP